MRGVDCFIAGRRYATHTFRAHKPCVQVHLRFRWTINYYVISLLHNRPPGALCTTTDATSLYGCWRLTVAGQPFGTSSHGLPFYFLSYTYHKRNSFEFFFCFFCECCSVKSAPNGKSLTTGTVSGPVAFSFLDVECPWVTRASARSSWQCVIRLNLL